MNALVPFDIHTQLIVTITDLRRRCPDLVAYILDLEDYDCLVAQVSNFSPTWPVRRDGKGVCSWDFAIEGWPPNLIVAKIPVYPCAARP